MTDRPIETCSVTELRRGLSRHIARVNESGQPLFITRRSEIVAVILSIELYESMQRQTAELVSQLRSAPPVPPTDSHNTEALRGVLKGAAVDEADYRRHLEEKYR